MVASAAGIKPSSVVEPFIIGTPASATLSFSTTVRPASLPLDAPLTSVLIAQALYLFSLAGGLAPGVRGYFTGGSGFGNSSMMSYWSNMPPISDRYSAASSTVMFMCRLAARSATSSAFGRLMDTSNPFL